MSHRGNGIEKGFTLIELSVVLLILAVLLAFLTPKFRDLTEYDIKSSSRRLAGTIRHLFDKAAIRHTYYRLNYDLKKDEYWVTYLDESKEFKEDSAVLSSRVRLPGNIHFEDIVTQGRGKVYDGETFTQFFPHGWVEETIIHLGDKRERHYSLLVMPLTGRVRIYDRYIEFVEKR
ncbi:MAG: prepilin-type N-terminal cleavage/methylation domain-containing protein [Syntrophobacterales bacterium]|nr:MAG: prepilin-type N-terminal cleavage/methylation domain-containing protein [Syntrophobacterales bacterium]